MRLGLTEAAAVGVALRHRNDRSSVEPPAAMGRQRQFAPVRSGRPSSPGRRPPLRPVEWQLPGFRRGSGRHAMLASGVECGADQVAGSACTLSLPESARPMGGPNTATGLTVGTLTRWPIAHMDSSGLPGFQMITVPATALLERPRKPLIAKAVYTAVARLMLSKSATLWSRPTAVGTEIGASASRCTAVAGRVDRCGDDLLWPYWRRTKSYRATHLRVCSAARPGAKSRLGGGCH